MTRQFVGSGRNPGARAEAMFRFQQLVLRDCPPVGDLDVAIDQHLTVIVGGSGSGKTTVFLALRTGRGPHGGSVALTTQGNREDLLGLEPLVFVDDNLMFRDFPRGLSPLVAAEVSNPDFWKRAAVLLANDLRLNRGNYLYRGIPYCGPETLDVRFTQDWEILVQTGAAARRLLPDLGATLFDSRIVAMGEQVFLRLSGSLAMREHVHLDTPLVIDDVFCVLDASRTATLMGLINRHASRRILVCSESVWSQVSEYCVGAKVVRLPCR